MIKTVASPHKAGTDSASKQAFLDGIPQPFTTGETILEFARRQRSKDSTTECHHNTSIPTLCYDARLKPYGSCRVCSVETAPTAEGPRRVVAACHTPVAEGMHIFTSSPRILRLRKNIVELVLTDYPVENSGAEFSVPGGSTHATRSQNGSPNHSTQGNGTNELSALAAELGLEQVRYRPGQNHLEQPKDTSHPYMVSDLTKCIMCYRCVRACDEIQGEFVLAAYGRGMESRIIKGLDQSFADSACVSCGACSQTCPTGAITDVFRATHKTPEKTVRTVCSYCGVGCNLEVAVADNEILAITAPETAAVNQGHTCLKGRYAFGFYNHPDRLRSPLLRRNGRLEPASWDEAYHQITAKLKQLIADHGPDSFAGISSARCTNEENYLMQKFIRAVVGTNNIDCCARVCHAPTAHGMQQAFGTGAATNSIEDIALADLLMIVGANPRTGHPVTGAKIKQAAMQGITLIVIDPVETELARMATHHLQLRPGTNVALLNLFAYFILTEDVADWAFIKDRCENFAAFAMSLRQLNLTTLEKTCGVNLQQVRAAALAYATAPRAMTFHGLGVTEHSQGSRTVMLIANLALMTGNIGKRGVGVNPLRGQNNVQGAADMGVQPHQGAGYLDVTDPAVQQLYSEHYGRPVPSHVGYKIPQMFDAAIRGDLKGLWIMGEDVAQTDPNTEHVRKSLENLELLVVQDIFLSETAKLADVVLPAASFFEKSGTFTNGERRVQRVNQVVDPLPGTRSDGQILVDILNRLGYPQPDYSAAGVLEEISRIVPFFTGAKWEELGENGKQWPIHKDGSDTKLLHEKQFKRGRGKFHYFDFEESAELIEHQDQFPLILTTGRNLVHYNCGTMTRRTANGQLVKEDLLLIHPHDAQARQIDDQELVHLASQRGQVRLRAQLSTEVKPGTLYTTFHFPELLVNRITSDVSDAESMCPEYKVTAVEVLKG